MARHALTEPATHLGPAEVAGLLCGAHAQVLSAAEPSIGRRIAGQTLSQGCARRGFIGALQVLLGCEAGVLAATDGDSE